MPTLGGPEAFIILLIVLIIFGAGKLPSVFRDFGKGVKEFKKAQTEEEAAAAAGPAATAHGSAATPPPAPSTTNSNTTATSQTS